MALSCPSCAVVQVLPEEGGLNEHLGTALDIQRQLVVVPNMQNPERQNVHDANDDGLSAKKKKTKNSHALATRAEATTQLGV